MTKFYPMNEDSQVTSNCIEPKENIKAYQETCNTIRHYSGSSYNVRVLVVVQGFVLMGAWILNYDKPSSNLLILISSLGLLFTILLSLFHYGYSFAAGYFYDLASLMENNLFDDTFKPFQAYNKVHKAKYKNIFARIFILYAPFTLTFICFVIIFIISLKK